MTGEASGRDQAAVIDRTALLDRVGGDVDLLREITNIFLAEYPALIGDIQEAVASRDARKLERAAHSLKGSVANFGAQGAVDASYRLETIGRRGLLEEAPDALATLLMDFQRLHPVLDGMAA
jgi:HPt (histidine-containing phosphotransfer) domain-containing protein